MKIPVTTKNRGFTLIELLVAMAITTIIVTVLVSITALSLDTWNRSRSEIRAARQGKAMIDSMAQDLESLVLRKGNNFEWLNAQSKPIEGPKGEDNPNAVEIFFFSAATDRYNGQIGVTDVDKGGDVSSIAYQLRYKDPIPNGTSDKAKTFVLYRKIVNPDRTFTSLLGQNKLDTAFVTLTGTGDDAVEAVENFVCENVYQFTVTFHVETTVLDASNKPVTKVVPISVGQDAKQAKEFFITGNGITSTYTGDLTADQLKSGRITTVEVSLTVITDFGLSQMRNRTFSSPEDFDEFIGKNSYQYSKMIAVPGS